MVYCVQLTVSKGLFVSLSHNKDLVLKNNKEDTKSPRNKKVILETMEPVIF